MEDDDYPPDKIDWITILICIVLLGLFIAVNIKKPKVEYKQFYDIHLAQSSIHHYPSFTVYASLAHLYPQDMRNTLTCESRWRHYNSDGTILRGEAGEFGIAQFMLTTFNQFKKEAGIEELNIYLAEDQLWLMEWAFEQGEKYKRHWSCWRALAEN